VDAILHHRPCRVMLGTIISHHWLAYVFGEFGGREKRKSGDGIAPRSLLLFREFSFDMTIEVTDSRYSTERRPHCARAKSLASSFKRREP